MSLIALPAPRDELAASLRAHVRSGLVISAVLGHALYLLVMGAIIGAMGV